MGDHWNIWRSPRDCQWWLFFRYYTQDQHLSVSGPQSREKLFICSELPTVSSPALMKGHQPLTRFCWNMEILFSSLAATTMPRSQLLAVFAARGNPFRFNSRVPGGRSNVTTLRGQTDVNAFKQQLPDGIHGAMQQPGLRLHSWGSPSTVSHSFVLSWHRLIQVPNYSLSKKYMFATWRLRERQPKVGSQMPLCTYLYKI